MINENCKVVLELMRETSSKLNQNMVILKNETTNKNEKLAKMIEVNYLITLIDSWHRTEDTPK